MNRLTKTANLTTLGALLLLGSASALADHTRKGADHRDHRTPAKVEVIRKAHAADHRLRALKHHGWVTRPVYRQHLRSQQLRARYLTQQRLLRQQQRLLNQQQRVLMERQRLISKRALKGHPHQVVEHHIAKRDQRHERQRHADKRWHHNRVQQKVVVRQQPARKGSADRRHRYDS
jgi:hypothetical protein